MRKAKCSFCGGGPAEDQKLISGPGVCICSGCVRLCVEILKHEAVIAPRSDGDGDTDMARSDRDAEADVSRLREELCEEGTETVVLPRAFSAKLFRALHEFEAYVEKCPETVVTAMALQKEGVLLRLIVGGPDGTVEILEQDLTAD